MECGGKAAAPYRHLVRQWRRLAAGRVSGLKVRTNGSTICLSDCLSIMAGWGLRRSGGLPIRDTADC